MIFATFLGGIINFVLEVYGLLILARVVISWFSINQKNEIVQIIIAFTDPVLIPARKIVPSVSGLDISPFVVLLALWFIKLYF